MDIAIYQVPPDGICTKANGKHIYSNGKIEYYQNGVLHRLPDANTVIAPGCVNDYPAVESKDGEYYYKEGLLHRDDNKPAVITNENAMWYKAGLLHRENNQPADEGYSKRFQRYAVNGKYHRTDGPAIIIGNERDGTANKLWMFNGKLHRIDGPAIECAYGREEYFLNGIFQVAGMKTYRPDELAPDGKPWQQVVNPYESDEEFAKVVFGKFMRNPDGSSVLASVTTK